MKHLELIVNAFSTPINSRNSWSSFSAGRNAIENLLNDKDATLSKEDAFKIVEVAKKDYYLGWIVSKYINHVIDKSESINDSISVELIEAYFKQIKDDDFFKSKILDSLSKDVRNIKNILKFSLFKNEGDIISFLKEKSKKSLKAFYALVLLKENNLLDGDFELIKSRVKKTINHLVPNGRNASVVCKSLYSKDIRDWISKDEEMRTNLVDFIFEFSAREVQASKMNLGKGILSIYIGDTINYPKAQKELINLICMRYFRYENRVLQLLQVEGSSPRNAFATILGLGKSPFFLCKKYPELKKFQTLM